MSIMTVAACECMYLGGHEPPKGLPVIVTTIRCSSASLSYTLHGHTYSLTQLMPILVLPCTY